MNRNISYLNNFPIVFKYVNNLGNQRLLHSLKRIYRTIPTKLNSSPSFTNPQLGNHDQPRLATRFSPDIAPAVTAIVQLLPGVAVTYYGEEIGMENTPLTWEETQDPQGCNAGKEGYEKASRDPARTPFQWDSTTSAGEYTHRR